MLAEVLVHIVGLVLGADVGVAGDGAHRLAQNGKGGEEPLGVLQQHVLGEDIPHAPLPQDKVGGQAGGDGNEAQGVLSVGLEAQHDVEHLVGQVGEGVAGVHHLGREDGLKLIPEPVFHLLALLGVHLVHGHAADVAGAQPLFQLLHRLVPQLVQGGDRLEDGGELLLWGLAGAAVHMGLLNEGHVVEGAHPDHEELVQVAGEDGGKFQPLHQGDALVPGLLQDPFIEPQPGQFPVLGIAGIHIFRHNDSSFPGGGGSGIRPHCAVQYTTEMKKERENFVKSGINLGKEISARTSRRPRSRGAAGCRRQSRGPCR